MALEDELMGLVHLSATSDGGIRHCIIKHTAYRQLMRRDRCQDTDLWSAALICIAVSILCGWILYSLISSNFVGAGRCVEHMAGQANSDADDNAGGASPVHES